MRGKLTFNELHQLKWLIGGVLTLLSLWALSGLDLIGFGLNSLIMLVIVIALLKPDWLHAIPSLFWSRFAVPLILALVLVDFTLGFTGLVAPLMRMVILLLVYRTLAPRNRREDLQMLLLCLFSIVVSGALTVSLLFAVQILLFTPVAMIFLLIVCLLDKGQTSADHQPDWEAFSLKRLIGNVLRVVQMRALILGGLLFAFVVMISTGFFILIPRFDLGQAIPFTQLDTRPRSGFSDTVSLDSVSEIVEDRSIVLRIDVPDIEAIHSLPYWRILVLDNYRDGEFRLSGQGSRLRRYFKLRELSQWTHRMLPPKLRKGKQWTFYFEGGVSRYLPLPIAFHSLRFTREQSVELLPDLHVVGLDAVQKSTFSYQLDDLSWDVRAPGSKLENEVLSQPAKDRELGRGAEVQYPLTTLSLNLSDTNKASLSKLNAQFTGSASKLSAAAYSEQVTAYLRANFRYSLKPNGVQGGDDPIINWLTSGSAGHCELYAGAFVLLAREAGYPARMVVGFVGGSWNAVEDFFVVRNSDAHAWAEIYDAETNEWLRVDPTPGDSSTNPEVVLPVSFALETGMWAWMDSLRMQWYRRVISFDQDDQMAVTISLIDAGDSLLDTVSTRFKEWIVSLKELFQKPLRYENLMWVGALLGICLGLCYLWRTFFIWSDLFVWLSGRPNSLTPVRRQASRYMNKVRVKMDQPTISKAFMRQLRDLYTQLEALRFGSNVSSQVAGDTFRKTRKTLRQRGK